MQRYSANHRGVDDEDFFNSILDCCNLQLLAVGHPHRVIAEVLGMVKEINLIDICHDANAELHVALLREAAMATCQPL